MPYKLTKLNITKLQKNPTEILKDLSEDDIAGILQQANQSYYNKTPLFSDDFFDMIKEYLEEKNPNHPILKNIGAAIEDALRKEALPYYMGSLDKIKGDVKDIEKFKTKYPGGYLVSDKLDGNSGLLQVLKNSVKLYTRGDGNTGQNISHVVPFIKNIPDLTKQKTELSVRGELIISKAAFEKIKHKGANARNMVAGMLNAKIPDLEIARAAEFVAYELIVPKMDPEVQFEYMAKLGFKIPYHKTLTQENMNNETLSKILIDRRDHSEYDVDGIVVMHDKTHKRITEGNPSCGFAFKSVHTMQKAEIIVSTVEWNLSKDGYLVPTVLFNGVSLNGVVIRRAAGFNGKFIKDNKIGPGSKIVIIRSGDVIPLITEILTPSETGEGSMPDVPYIWSKTGVDIMLSEEHKKDNDELKLKNIQSFIDKIDIPGLGPGNVKKMFDSGFNTVKKVFAASINDLLTVDGFKEKSATKIYEALQARKKTLDCLTMMDASNTMGRGLGGKKLELIIQAFPKILETRYVPTVTELTKLKGVEKTTADLFIGNLPTFFKFVDDNDLDCMEAPKKVAPMAAAVAASSGEPKGPDFTGEKIIFTGVRNKELETYIKEHGGEITTSVSKKTTLVICKDPDEDSGKIMKAKELGIKVIEINAFIKTHKITL